MIQHRGEGPGAGALWLVIGVIVVLVVFGVMAAGFFAFQVRQDAVVMEDLAAQATQEARAEELAHGDGGGRRVHLRHQGTDTLFHWEREDRWLLHTRRDGRTKVVLGVNLPVPDLEQEALVVRPGLDITGLAGLIEVSPTAFHTHVDVARLPDAKELEQLCVVQLKSWEEVRQSLLPSADPGDDH